MNDVVPREMDNAVALQLDVREATTVALPAKVACVSFETITLDDEVSLRKEKVDPVAVTVRNGQRHLAFRHGKPALSYETCELHLER
jgi:hypothetical protein